ncbi:hypothetical protein F8M41_019972 [Gigaspora margarita]|uniref:Uncharacterized protein n=1 Tax=Gigaspora margarita TaxID=4874 RepID=A0A8H4AJ93_GIGMA|nr:hypothetical protein F8M41_019972 [Gigaspora margarita]
MAEPNDNENSIEVVSNEIPQNDTTQSGSSNISERPMFIYDTSISPNFKYLAIWGKPYRDTQHRWRILWNFIKEEFLTDKINVRNREIKYDAIYSLKFDFRAAFSNTKKLMAIIYGRELVIFSVKTGIPIITKNLKESFNCIEFIVNGHDEYLLVYFRPNKRYNQEHHPLNELDKKNDECEDGNVYDGWSDYLPSVPKPFKNCLHVILRSLYDEIQNEFISKERQIRMVDEIIYNKLLLVVFGPELLRCAIRSKYDDAVIKLFDKFIDYFNENPLQSACFMGVISYSLKSLQKHHHIQATKFIDLICNILDPLNPASLASFKILYLRLPLSSCYLP